MLIHNVNTSDGLTNGAQGKVMKVLTDGEKLDTLWSNLTIRRLENFKDRNLSSLAPNVTSLKKLRLNGSASATP